MSLIINFSKRSEGTTFEGLIFVEDIVCKYTIHRLMIKFRDIYNYKNCFKFIEENRQILSEKEFNILRKRIILLFLLKNIFRIRNSLDRKYKLITICGFTFKTKRF